MVSFSPIGSVVIPAHNESVVIRRCLEALLSGFAPGELDVVVSCNGCTDDTADIVRSYWPAVRVVELAQASKTAALRAADEALSVFPRIYMDADVVLPAVTARLIIEYLRTDSALAARPSPGYDTSQGDALVRSYHRARARLLARTQALWAGDGVYGVSAAGRARYGAYPDVIADDLFAAQWFRPSEVKIIGSAPTVVTAPRRTRDLIRIMRRRYQGNADLRGGQDGPASTVSATLRDLAAVARSSPRAAADTATYLGIAVVGRITRAVSPPAGWARDESSRVKAITST
jgi:glycosyltransferase involved in cell wall biosynthesis